MPADYLERLQTDRKANPLFAFLGVEPTLISPEKAVLTLSFQEGFLQGAGNLAGGIQAALMDEAMAHVVLATLLPGQQTVTMDLHMRYLAPAGRETLRAEANIVRKGKRVVVVEGEITGDEGRSISLATASFLILERRAD